MTRRLILRTTVLLIVSFTISEFIFATTIHKDNPRNAADVYQSGGSEWKAPASADKMKNPLAKNPKAAKDAKDVYSNNCASCHGDNGKGDGPAAVELDPKPKDLTSAIVQKQSDGALFWKITTGNPPMEAWKDVLTEKQRWGLVNYIRQFKKK